MLKFLVIIFLSSMFTFAQIDISRVSFDVGYVKNYQNFEDYQFSYFPEIKIGGMFYSSVFEWEVYTNYWDDGINAELEGVVDRTSYSHSNLTIGSKIYYLPSKYRFFLFFNGGLSYRHITQTYIGGSQTGSNKDSNYDIISLDIGVGIKYKINSKLRLRFEGNTYLALNELDKRSSIGGLKFGLDYFFK